MKLTDFRNLTREELFVFAAEAKSTNDQQLLDEITDEIKRRNLKESKEVLNENNINR